MSEDLIWSAEAAAYIASRSSRYPDGLDLAPEWADEAMADPDLAAFEPDPKSRIGAARFTGIHQAPPASWS